MPNSRPRMACISWEDLVNRSSPSSRTFPPTVRPAGLGTNPIMDRAVMLLPQPDSPAIPRASPGSGVKLTPSTALTTPVRVKK